MATGTSRSAWLVIRSPARLVPAPYPQRSAQEYQRRDGLRLVPIPVGAMRHGFVEGSKAIGKIVRENEVWRIRPRLLVIAVD